MVKSWTSKPSLTTSRIHTAKHEDSYLSPRLYKHDSASRSRYTPIYPFYTHNPPHSYTNLSARVLTCLQICSPPGTKFDVLHTRAPWTTTTTNTVSGGTLKGPMGAVAPPIKKNPPGTKFTLLHTRAPWTTTTTNAVSGGTLKGPMGAVAPPLKKIKIKFHM